MGEYGIQLLTVYGNDYLQQSIDVANYIWDAPRNREIARKGMFCTADSSNLTFAPASSFDFVYTGYIDPILDPLNLLPPMATAFQKRANAIKNCKSLNWEYQRVAQEDQLAQEEWYASWVTEMIRIAKPGKVIVIENSAESLCRQSDDWGGVDKEWWRMAVSKYAWDVDPWSIVVRDMPRRKEWKAFRYHVMMRKT